MEVRKIVFIVNTAITAVHFRKDLITHLCDLGHNVTIYCPKACKLLGKSDVTGVINELGANHREVNISRGGTNLFWELFSIINICRALMVDKPDVVMNYTIKANIYGSIASRIVGVPKTISNVTGLGEVFISNVFKFAILRQIIVFAYRYALEKNFLVFFQNEDDLVLFKNLKMMAGSRYVVLNGSGVNMEFFKPDKNEQIAKSFILVARLLKSKGIREYIEAAKLVKMDHPDAVFYLLGPVDENPSSLTLRQIREWDREGLIQYVPPQVDVRPYLAKAQVFVLPSYREGTPRSVLEAMSMAMPIITTNAPGCRQTVVEGVNGFKVPVRSIADLASAMCKFIQNQDLVQQMGAESHKICQTKYDVKVVNKIVVEALQL